MAIEEAQSKRTHSSAVIPAFFRKGGFFYVREKI